MLISQKTQYALRAAFELACHHGQGWVKISVIAKAQAIPPRFLEVILGQLKQAGFVVSRRGKEGGYMLARAPDEVTVGDVLRFMEGSIGPIECIAGDSSKDKCSLYGHCAFRSLWERAERALSEIYDTTTLQDLLDEQAHLADRQVSRYSI